MEGPRSNNKDNHPVAHTRVLRAIRVRTPPAPAPSLDDTNLHTVGVKHYWTLPNPRAFL